MKNLRTMQAILLWAVWAGGISGAVEVPALGQQLQSQSLDPVWKFATDPDKVGADQEWFAPSFDDSNWAKLRTDKGVGWEMQGFGGYVGFGPPLLLTPGYRRAFSSMGR